MNVDIKNKQTGKHEVIRTEHQELDWGFRMLIETELDAYKVAYEYRNNKFGTQVEFAGGASCWMVTVFNERGDKLGFNK